MTWLAALTGLIKIVGLIAEYLGRKQLIDAGEAKAIAEGQKNVLDNLSRIKASRETLSDPGSNRNQRVRDKFRRD